MIFKKLSPKYSRIWVLNQIYPIGKAALFSGVFQHINHYVPIVLTESQDYGILYVGDTMNNLRKGEQGQTLVEYTLLLTVISATCVSFFGKISAGVSIAMTSLGNVLDATPVVPATIQPEQVGHFAPFSLLWYLMALVAIWAAVSFTKRRA